MPPDSSGLTRFPAFCSAGLGEIPGGLSRSLGRLALGRIDAADIAG